MLLLAELPPMQFVRPDLNFTDLLPFLALAMLMVICLIFEMKPEASAGEGASSRPVAIVFASLGLLAVIGFYLGRGLDEVSTTFNGMLINDPLSRAAGLLICGCAFLAILAGQDELERHGNREGGEFTALIIASSLGMLLMASAANAMVLFLGLELFSIALYLLCIFFTKKAFCQEAGLKYFLLSSSASAILLYGLAMIYGATGSTWFSEMDRGGKEPTAILLVGGILVLCGLLFKLAAVPFSSWAPDVYEGAPTTVTAFMSVATKVAALVALIRVFVLQAPEGLAYYSSLIVVTASMMSMIFGHLIAIYQKSVKRMLAYSGIGNAGYVLIAPAVGMGMESPVMFFLIAYMFGNIGAFLALSAIEGILGREVQTTDLRGLYHRYPLLSGAFALCLASLAGLPPTGGFVGKFVLFGKAISFGNILLPAVAILCSVIAAGYYFGLAISLFDGNLVAKDDDSKVVTEPEEAASGLTVLALGICLVGVLLTGMVPQSLLSWLG